MAIRTLVPKALGQPLGMYSHGMAAAGGEIVVVAGQVGVGPSGQLAGPEVGAQTRQALENVGAVLAEGGCGWSDVIRLQTFLTSADDIPDFMAARAEVFPRCFPGGAYPPNTLLVVSRLVRPDLRVEVEAMAVRSSRASGRGGSRLRARRPVARKPTARRRSRS